MRTIPFILIITLTAAASGVLTYLITNNKFINLQEDIITNEFRLSETAKEITPKCGLKEPVLVKSMKDGVFVVFLPIDDNSNLIEKIVLDRSGHSVVERVELTCE